MCRGQYLGLYYFRHLVLIISQLCTIFFMADFSCYFIVMCVLIMFQVYCNPTKLPWSGLKEGYEDGLRKLPRPLMQTNWFNFASIE